MRHSIYIKSGRFAPAMMLIAAVAVSGCATRAQQNAAIELPGENPQETVLPERGTSEAVLSLLNKARQATLAGDYPRAEVLLERTVRIEPRNASLWHYLAKLRLAQNRYREAVGLAQKSNNLARANNKLRADNWRIIAHARYQTGDIAGAERAQQKARTLTKP